MVILAMKLIVVGIVALTVSVNAKKGFGPGSQEYGYVDVREGAHMFYWLYYRNTVPESKAVHYPLVIWLQGGPGSSSTAFGNFQELGTLDTDLKPRKYAWTKYVNVLFIDNPVGTGFSYVDKESLYVKTNHEVAVDLITFTKAFYKKFSKFSETPMYIFSESYGGKMAVQFAYELHKEIKKTNLKINLKGIALGDSFISPIDSTLAWPTYLFTLSTTDKVGFDAVNEGAQKLKNLIDNEQWGNATNAWFQLQNTVYSVTNDVNFYNILDENDNKQKKKFENGKTKNWGLYGRLKNEDLDAIMNGKVKPALKIIPPKLSFNEQSEDVFDSLNDDFMKPVVNYVEKVLNETDIQLTVYSGQLDPLVSTLGTMLWVDRLKWPHAEDWQTKANVEILFSSNKKSLREGRFKTYDKFSFFWIDNAGHMVPQDNPVAALALLRNITYFDKTFDSNDITP